jgi:hypothetical protein
MSEVLKFYRPFRLPLERSKFITLNEFVTKLYISEFSLTSHIWIHYCVSHKIRYFVSHFGTLTVQPLIYLTIDQTICEVDNLATQIISPQPSPRGDHCPSFESLPLSRPWLQPWALSEILLSYFIIHCNEVNDIRLMLRQSCSLPIPTISLWPPFDGPALPALSISRRQSLISNSYLLTSTWGSYLGLGNSR